MKAWEQKKIEELEYEKHHLIELKTKDIDAIIEHYTYEEEIQGKHFDKYACVEWFIQNYPDVHCSSESIDLAADYGCLELLKLLKKSYSRVSCTPTGILRASRRYTHIVEWLRKNYPNVKPTTQVMDEAAGNQNIPRLNLLKDLYEDSRFSWRALYTSVLYRNPTIFKWLCHNRHRLCSKPDNNSVFTGISLQSLKLLTIVYDLDPSFAYRWSYHPKYLKHYECMAFVILQPCTIRHKDYEDAIVHLDTLFTLGDTAPMSEPRMNSLDLICERRSLVRKGYSLMDQRFTNGITKSKKQRSI